MLNHRGGTESDLTVSRLAPGSQDSPLSPAFEGKTCVGGGNDVLTPQLVYQSPPHSFHLNTPPPVMGKGLIACSCRPGVLTWEGEMVVSIAGGTLPPQRWGAEKGAQLVPLGEGPSISRKSRSLG